MPSSSDFTYGHPDAGPRDGGIDAGPRLDGGATCVEPEMECGSGCVDTDTSLEHCGECGNPCAATDLCRAGECIDPVVEVEADIRHTCARRGSGEVWCWGDNLYGQLGDGTQIDRLVPVRVVDVGDAQRIATATLRVFFTGGTGLVHFGRSCARRSSGAVVCWGANFGRLLGSASGEVALVRPADVSGLGVVGDFDLSETNNCGIAADQTVTCWGGVLADGMMTPRAPYVVAPLGVIGGWASQVSVGPLHSCGLRTSGEVYCWGDNSDGQLGDSAAASLDDPTLVAGLDGAIEVATGGNFLLTQIEGVSCARMQDDTVRCWGRADLVGAGFTIEEPHPTPETVLGLSEVVALRGSLLTMCAIHGADRRVSCWGVGSPTPVEIAGFAGVVDVSVGGATCVVLDDGTIRCWGSNGSGQLGDGTMDDRDTPAPVTGLP